MIAVLIALLIAGCAQALPGYSPDLRVQQNQAKAAKEAAGAGRLEPSGQYTLGPDELALDCKKLTGRMQVRILQIRDHNERSVGTGVARAAQQVAQPVFGGATYGARPDADVARDRAVLEAYNRQLAAKNCKTFDLDAELRPKPVRETPTPTAKTK
jgi:hypothetical protein